MIKTFSPVLSFMQSTNSWLTKREWQQLWRTPRCWRWLTSALPPGAPEQPIRFTTCGKRAWQVNNVLLCQIITCSDTAGRDQCESSVQGVSWRKPKWFFCLKKKKRQKERFWWFSHYKSNRKCSSLYWIIGSKQKYLLCLNFCGKSWTSLPLRSSHKIPFFSCEIFWMNQWINYFKDEVFKSSTSAQSLQ